MGNKANQYGDADRDGLGHSGVQSWSAGASFPYVTFLREYWKNGQLISARVIVSLAGVELIAARDWADGERLALELKARGIRTREESSEYANSSERMGALRAACTDADLGRVGDRPWNISEREAKVLEDIWQAREDARNQRAIEARMADARATLYAEGGGMSAREAMPRTCHNLLPGESFSGLDFGSGTPAGGNLVSYRRSEREAMAGVYSTPQDLPEHVSVRNMNRYTLRSGAASE